MATRHKASKSGDGHHKSMSRLSEQQWPNWQADFTGNVLMYFDFSENRLPYYPTPRNALSVGWLVGHVFYPHLTRTVTRPERPKGAKDEVKQARRAQSRPIGPQTRSWGPEGPLNFYTVYWGKCFLSKNNKLLTFTACSLFNCCM